MNSLDKVKCIIEDFVRMIEDGFPPFIMLKSSKQGPSCLRMSNKRSWRRIAVFMKVLSIALPGLINGSVLVMKREVYYMDTGLFKFANDIDWAIDLLCTTLEVSRDGIGIQSSAKGLAFGDLSLKTSTETAALDFSKCTVNIKNWKDVEIISAPALVLVVEKEAVFQGISQQFSDIKAALKTSLLIVTGKGYPCLPTLKFIHRLHLQCPDTRFFVLVDYDPYGIDIAMQYRMGSKLLRESFCPKLEHIGITRSQIDKFAPALLTDQSLYTMNQRALKLLNKCRNRASMIGWQSMVKMCDEMAVSAFCTEIEKIYSHCHSNLTGLIVDAIFAKLS